MEIIFTKKPEQISPTPPDIKENENNSILVPRMVGESVLEIPAGNYGVVWSNSNTCVNIKFGTRVVVLVRRYEQMAPTNVLCDLPVNFAQQICVRMAHGICFPAQIISFENVPVFSGNILPAQINKMTVKEVQSLLVNKNETLIYKSMINNADAGKWQNLIGLGPGSTPSGDDFLCGALAAEQLLNVQSEISRDVSIALTPEATTLLGYTMLTDALSGRFPVILHEMVRELQYDFPYIFWYNIIYSSSLHSPADFCAGLIWNINYLLEKT